MPTDVVLCKASEIAEGTVKHFEIMGYDIAVANLADGHIDREKKALVCASCKGSWDLETGQPRDPPAKFPLTVYEVQLAGDDLVFTFTY